MLDLGLHGGGKRRARHAKDQTHVSAFRLAAAVCSDALYGCSASCTALQLFFLPCFMARFLLCSASCSQDCSKMAPNSTPKQLQNRSDGLLASSWNCLGSLQASWRPLSSLEDSGRNFSTADHSRAQQAGGSHANAYQRHGGGYSYGIVSTS